LPEIVVVTNEWLTYWVRSPGRDGQLARHAQCHRGRVHRPEFIQHDAKPDRIAAVPTTSGNASKRDLMRQELATVVSKLGGAGASKRAARIDLTAL